MPVTPSSPLRRSHLLARLPARGVPAFLKKLANLGVSLEDGNFDEPTVMDSSTPGESVLMAWVLGAPAQLDRLRREGCVLSLSAGDLCTHPLPLPSGTAGTGTVPKPATKSAPKKRVPRAAPSTKV